ncbi:transposase [Saccharopolyspora spinosa]|nr:transposase [Saccharopolyspora spinosa]
MDTITLIRSAICGLLTAAGADLAARLRAVVTSEDDYVCTAKPLIDWDDQAARDALIDSRAQDRFAMLALLDGVEIAEDADKAARLLAKVLGQDLTDDDDGVLRIARRVAADRVIYTVDPETRHGHKTQAHGFDGHKGHIAIDPDSESITATNVSSGNSGDAEAAETLLADILPPRSRSRSRSFG